MSNFEEQDSLNGYLDGLDGCERRSIDVAKSLVGGKEKVTVEFHRMRETPVRAESPARNHTFSDVDGFIQYLSRYGTKDAVVLVDIAREKARATLNEAACGGLEFLRFNPLVHPLLEPWAQIVSSKLSAENMVTFLRKNKSVITSPKARDLIMVLSQVKISKSVTIQTGTGAHSMNGLMCETKLAGQQGSTEVDLPETITICVPVFHRADQVEIVFDLEVSETDGKALFVLHSSDLTVKRLLAMQTMGAAIQAELPENIVSFGVMDYEPWEYTNKP